MTDFGKPYQGAHEVGRIYDAITDSRILTEFFLTTVQKFIPATQSYLLLATQNKTLLLDASVPSVKEIPAGLVAAAQKAFEAGKPLVAGHSMFLPLIARNSAMGVACLERISFSPPVFTPELEFGTFHKHKTASGLTESLK